MTRILNSSCNLTIGGCEWAVGTARMTEQITRAVIMSKCFFIVSFGSSFIRNRISFVNRNGKSFQPMTRYTPSAGTASPTRLARCWENSIRRSRPK